MNLCLCTSQVSWHCRDPLQPLATSGLLSWARGTLTEIFRMLDHRWMDAHPGQELEPDIFRHFCKRKTLSTKTVGTIQK